MQLGGSARSLSATSSFLSGAASTPSAAHHHRSPSDDRQGLLSQRTSSGRGPHPTAGGAQARGAPAASSAAASPAPLPPPPFSSSAGFSSGPSGSTPRSVPRSAGSPARPVHPSPPSPQRWQRSPSAPRAVPRGPDGAPRGRAGPSDGSGSGPGGAPRERAGPSDGSGSGPGGASRAGGASSSSSSSWQHPQARTPRGGAPFRAADSGARGPGPAADGRNAGDAGDGQPAACAAGSGADDAAGNTGGSGGQGADGDADNDGDDADADDADVSVGQSKPDRSGRANASPSSPPTKAGAPCARSPLLAPSKGATPPAPSLEDVTAALQPSRSPSRRCAPSVFSSLSSSLGSAGGPAPRWAALPPRASRDLSSTRPCGNVPETSGASGVSLSSSSRASLGAPVTPSQPQERTAPPRLDTLGTLSFGRLELAGTGETEPCDEPAEEPTRARSAASGKGAATSAKREDALPAEVSPTPEAPGSASADAAKSPPQPALRLPFSSRKVDGASPDPGSAAGFPSPDAATRPPLLGVVLMDGPFGGGLSVYSSVPSMDAPLAASAESPDEDAARTGVQSRTTPSASQDLSPLHVPARSFSSTAERSPSCSLDDHLAPISEAALEGADVTTSPRSPKPLSALASLTASGPELPSAPPSSASSAKQVAQRSVASLSVGPATPQAPAKDLAALVGDRPADAHPVERSLADERQGASSSTLANDRPVAQLPALHPDAPLGIPLQFSRRSPPPIPSLSLSSPTSPPLPPSPFSSSAKEPVGLPPAAAASHTSPTPLPPGCSIPRNAYPKGITIRAKRRL